MKNYRTDRQTDSWERRYNGTGNPLSFLVMGRGVGNWFDSSMGTGKQAGFVGVFLWHCL